MSIMERHFVLHRHSGHGPLHWDLMLESGEALATWQLARSPAELAPGASLAARRLPDHRRAYLSYEGPVSGGRGRVDRVDMGQYEPLADDEGRWIVLLNGTVLKGRHELRRAGPGAEDWTLERLGDSTTT